MLTKDMNAEIKGDLQPRFEEILSNDALNFLKKLHYHFNDRRLNLLKIRKELQQKINEGKQLDFLSETKNVREGDWTIGPLPKDLQDRRVELTGTVDRKMISYALHPWAQCYMADFEAATSPTWEYRLNGQIDLKDAIGGQVDFTAYNGRLYSLNGERALLIVRPRGWH